MVTCLQPEPFAALRHFPLELLVGELERFTQVNEHVGHGPATATRPVPWVGHIAVGDRRVQPADDVQDGSLGKQRCIIVFVDLLLHPVVVVSNTVERKLVVAPYGLDTHPNARCVKVWLKGDNLGVLV